MRCRWPDLSVFCRNLWQKWLQVPRLKQLTEGELVASSSLQLQYINAEQDNPSFEDAV